MTKNMRDILKEVEGPRTADAKKFVNDIHRRHLTLDADDPTNDAPYDGSNVAKDHSKKNGYQPGEDVKAYAAAQGRARIVKAADNDESKLPNKSKGANVPNTIVDPNPHLDPVPTRKTTSFAAENIDHDATARENMHDVKKDLDGVEVLDLRTSKARDLMNIIATASKRASGVTEDTLNEVGKRKTWRETKAMDAKIKAKKSKENLGNSKEDDENDAKAASMGIDRNKAPLRKEDLDILEGRFQLNWKSNSKFQGKPLSSHTFSVKAKNQDDAIKRAAKYIEKVDGSDNAHAVVPHNVFRVSEDYEWPEGTITIDEAKPFKLKVDALGAAMRQSRADEKTASKAKAVANRNKKLGLKEMSSDTIANYAVAAADARKNSSKYEKRTKGIKLADRKLTGKAKVSAKVMEAIEHLPLDEVSKKTLRSYHDKATKWQDDTNSDKPPENAHNVVSANGKKTYKWAQRANNMDLADRKLSGPYYKGAKPVKQRATEEALIELSTKTLASYASKAHTDSHKLAKDLDDTKMSSMFLKNSDKAANGKKQAAIKKKMDNRSRGIGKAMGRVMARNEDFDPLDESYAEVKDIQFKAALDLVDQIASLIELMSHDEEAYYSAAASNQDGIVKNTTDYPPMWSTDLGFCVKQLEDVRNALLAAKPDHE